MPAAKRDRQVAEERAISSEVVLTTEQRRAADEAALVGRGPRGHGYRAGGKAGQGWRGWEEEGAKPVQGDRRGP